MKDGSHYLTALTARDLLEYARALHDYPPEEVFCLETLNACIEKTGLQAVPYQGTWFHLEPIPA